MAGDIAQYSNPNLTQAFKNPEDQNMMDLFKNTIVRSPSILSGPKAPRDIDKRELRGKPSIPDPHVVTTQSVSLDDVLNIAQSEPQPTFNELKQKTEELIKSQKVLSPIYVGKGNFPSPANMSDSSLIAMLVALLSIYAPPEQFNTNPIIADAKQRLGQ